MSYLLTQALALLEEATSYTSCETWSPSLTDEINSFVVNARAALAATPAAAPIGYLTRFKVEVEQQRQQFPGEEPDYLWRYTHGTKDLTTWEADDRQEVVRLYGQPTAEARAALAATPAPAPIIAARYRNSPEGRWNYADHDLGNIERDGWREVVYLCDVNATPAPAPQGWKLVPVEPTPEMVKALKAKIIVGNQGGVMGVASAYRAMLAAAPEAATPAPEPAVVGWLYQHAETGRTRVVTPDMVADCDARWFKVGDLVLAGQGKEASK